LVSFCAFWLPNSKVPLRLCCSSVPLSARFRRPSRQPDEVTRLNIRGLNCSSITWAREAKSKPLGHKFLWQIKQNWVHEDLRLFKTMSQTLASHNWPPNGKVQVRLRRMLTHNPASGSRCSRHMEAVLGRVQAPNRQNDERRP
jgi:hypothetical protein